MRVFTEKDVVNLLRAEVTRAGSQLAWARKARVDRTMVNKILKGQDRCKRLIVQKIALPIVDSGKVPEEGIVGQTVHCMKISFSFALLRSLVKELISAPDD